MDGLIVFFIGFKSCLSGNNKADAKRKETYASENTLSGCITLLLCLVEPVPRENEAMDLDDCTIDCLVHLLMSRKE